MKIKAHNPPTYANLDQQPTLKFSKVVNKKNLPKIKAAASKENISSENSIPDAKSMKTLPQILNQTTLKVRNDREVTAVTEYQKQILKYVREKQSRQKIETDYLRKSHSITVQIRSSFVKLFFKIGKKFKLKRTTIFLAVYYMDAFLSKNLQIQTKQAIIAAQACLFIATKYEEIYPPELFQWAHSLKEIILYQAQILKALDFDLIHCSIENHLEYFFSKLDIGEKDKEMIRLIADVSLFDELNYKFTSGELSSAIVYSILNPSKLEEKIEMNLKWMIERNQKHMEWLQLHKYSNNKPKTKN